MAERNNAIDHKFRFYPGIDLSYRPTNAWRLFASWNKSLRLPSFTDLWYKSPTQEGNVGLKPEECSAFRIGADFIHRIVTLRFNARYQRGTHMIDWVMRSAEDSKYYATSFSLDNYGVGADARISLSEWWGKRQPFEWLTLSYAWTTQHRRAGEPYFKSNYAMEYLRHKLWHICTTVSCRALVPTGLCVCSSARAPIWCIRLPSLPPTCVLTAHMPCSTANCSGLPRATRSLPT